MLLNALEGRIMELQSAVRHWIIVPQVSWRNQAITLTTPSPTVAGTAPLGLLSVIGYFVNHEQVATTRFQAGRWKLRATRQVRTTEVSFRSMPRKNILVLLEGEDRRSIGRADEVAAAVSKNHALFPRL